MKHTYFLLFSLFCFTAAAQTGQVGTYFTSDIPVKSVMPKMSANTGMGLQFAYKPVPKFPVMLEMKGSIGNYSTQTLSQTFVFGDNSKTTTNVSYSSNMNRVTFGTKIHIGHEFRSVRGFVTPQIGSVWMKSKIRVADPQDVDDCQPLQKATTHRSSGFVYGGEAGVEVGFDKLFRGATESKHKLYASVSYLASFNSMDYVNVKYMQDHDHAAMHSGEASDREITTQFINVSTNNIHEHKIAELYSTPLRFVGINIGYVFNF